jgi:membrane protease YdiL (CAAX protease family)
MMGHLSGGILDEDIVQTEALPPAIQEPPKHGLRWIFIGTNGLRAGWGVLLFVALYVLFLLVMGRLLRPFLREARHLTVLPVRVALITEFAQFLPTILATSIMAFIERRSVLAYGYQGTAKAVRFFSGLVWGFIALSVFVLTLWKAHLLAFDGELLHGNDILKYALGWGLVFLMVAFFEEFTLTRGIGFWWGALLLSLLFGFSHGTNPGETPVGLFAAAAVGLIFCLSLWYTGSLWWAVGFHASWDWAESYFYGTSDSGLVVRGHLLGEHPIGPRLWSGGTTGPEGSLLVLFLLVIAAILMRLWWGPRVESPFRNSGWKPAWLRKPVETLPL